MTRFDSWVGKIPWRRDRLHSPVFLGFPCGSAGKESARNVGDLGSVSELGRYPGEGKRVPTPVFWPRESHGLYSPWGRKELDTTERLSLHLTHPNLTLFRPRSLVISTSPYAMGNILSLSYVSFSVVLNVNTTIFEAATFPSLHQWHEVG